LGTFVVQQAMVATPLLSSNGVVALLGCLRVVLFAAQQPCNHAV